jgi:Arc/MetJ-type ribon-helix-helix transcriptional regulator
MKGERRAMEQELRIILAACIQEIDSDSSDLEHCLKRYGNESEELRSHLELWLRFRSTEKAQRTEAALQKGRAALLAEAASMKGGMRGMINRWAASSFARAAAVLVAGVMVLGGGAGASAALGGPDPAGNALESIGVMAPREAPDDPNDCIEFNPEPGQAEEPAPPPTSGDALGCP